MAEQTLYDVDGNEVIVPDAEEITSLKESKTKVTTLEEDLKKAQAEKVELEKGANPNWKEVRENEKRMKATIEDLKKQGKALDKDGKVVEAPQAVSTDDVVKTAEAVTQKVLVDNKLSEALSQLPEDKRDQVKEVFSKLTVDTTINVANFDNYFEQAAGALGINKPVDQIRGAVNSRGKAPNIGSKGELNEKQKGVASMLGITEADLDKYNKK